MMYKDEQILSMQGIQRGEMANGLLFYNIIAKDINGNEFVLALAVKTNYQESVEKTFKRTFPVRAPWDKPNAVPEQLPKEEPQVDPRQTTINEVIKNANLAEGAKDERETTSEN